MDATETENAVDALLNQYDVEYIVTLVGPTRRDKWDCDQWRVLLQGPKSKRPIAARFETSFYTGTGLRKGNGKDKKSPLYRERPVKPSAASVLYSLLLDFETSHQSFSHWCDAFDYNSDSMKDFNLYQQCCEIGKQLSTIFNHEQRKALSEALQDY